jgi:hypothetical protein
MIAEVGSNSIDPAFWLIAISRACVFIRWSLCTIKFVQLDVDAGEMRMLYCRQLISTTCIIILGMSNGAQGFSSSERQFILGGDIFIVKVHIRFSKQWRLTYKGI